MTIVESCPKCGKKGSLHLVRTRQYLYWRIAHYKDYDRETTGTRHYNYCYIGKELPEELKRLVENESKCPQCGIKGYLQVRGKSARIGHYKGYKANTRIIEWHKVDYAP